MLTKYSFYCPEVYVFWSSARSLPVYTIYYLVLETKMQSMEASIFNHFVIKMWLKTCLSLTQFPAQICKAVSYHFQNCYHGVES